LLIFKCADQKIICHTESDERYTLKDLTRNKNIALKKADRGTTTVIMIVISFALVKFYAFAILYVLVLMQIKLVVVVVVVVVVVEQTRQN